MSLESIKQVVEELRHNVLMSPDREVTVHAVMKVNDIMQNQMLPAFQQAQQSHLISHDLLHSLLVNIGNCIRDILDLGETISNSNPSVPESNPSSDDVRNKLLNMDSPFENINLLQPDGKDRKNYPPEVQKILFQWIVDHPDDKFLSDADKHFLITQTGLSLKQVNDWFTNARRRYYSNSTALDKALSKRGIK
ncbi:hypothetical protein HK098_004925 [Nowakowskiella sp. JEL0407]|nr:hypothetical protein HK098_004925 [Nowakowskiella sp. JEL0407]